MITESAGPIDLKGVHDPRAESRFRRAQAAFDDGAFAEATDIFEQALLLEPNWVGAWVALTAAAVAAGDRPLAMRAASKALRLDPADRHGVGLLVARLGSADVPHRAPVAYVAALFDHYADRFEAHLTQTLAYSGPADICAALQAAAFVRATQAMDLGCGTGLCGAMLRSHVDWLIGVDLSPGMIAKASAKTIDGRPLYDRLVAGDLEVALSAQTAGTLDLVTAADVLIYIGDLVPIFAAVGRALRPGGLFAFTAQTPEDDGAIVLGADLRFAHASDHLVAVAEAAGFAVIVNNDKSVRREKDRAVPGLVMVAQRL